MTDTALLDDLSRASAAVSELMDQIPDAGWVAPTPCSQWSVRDLVGHLVGTNLVFVAMLEGSAMPDRSVDHLGADPAEAFRRTSAALQAAAARPGVMEQSQTSPLGSATGAERLRWRVADLLVHGWDLAQAIGTPARLPGDLVERVLGFVRAQLPGQPRTGRFAEPQPVPDDAPALDQLIAFTGRPVSWSAPTGS